MVYVAGVDVGSTQAKAVILDDQARVVGEAILDVEMNMSTAAQQVFDKVVANASLASDDIAFTVATGYGRYRVTFGDLQSLRSVAMRAAPRQSFRARAPCSILAGKIPRRFALAKQARWWTSR